MSYDSERVAEYLCRVETLAEDILADKHSMTELDRRRNKNREAMRQLMNEEKEAKGKKQVGWVRDRGSAKFCLMISVVITPP